MLGWAWGCWSVAVAAIHWGVDGALACGPVHHPIPDILVPLGKKGQSMRPTLTLRKVPRLRESKSHKSCLQFVSMTRGRKWQRAEEIALCALHRFYPWIPRYMVHQEWSLCIEPEVSSEYCPVWLNKPTKQKMAKKLCFDSSGYNNKQQNQPKKFPKDMLSPCNCVIITSTVNEQNVKRHELHLRHGLSECYTFYCFKLEWLSEISRILCVISQKSCLT